MNDNICVKNNFPSLYNAATLKRCSFPKESTQEYVSKIVLSQNTHRLIVHITYIFIFHLLGMPLKEGIQFQYFLRVCFPKN